MKNNKNKYKELIQRTNLNKGITLVALVITIVILIILATITINSAFGEGGLIQKAQQAKNLTEEATKKEQEALNSILDEYANIMAEDTETIPTPEPDAPIDFGDLTEEEKNSMIGKYVDYKPTMGTFTDHTDMAKSGDNSNVELSTEENLKWRILFIEDNKLILISDTATEEKMSLGAPTGFNNGVLLLNNACKTMYSNNSLGAIGRNLNLEDIEKESSFDKTSYVNPMYEFKYGDEEIFFVNYPGPKISAYEETFETNGIKGEYGLSEQEEYIPDGSEPIPGLLEDNQEQKGMVSYYEFQITQDTMHKPIYAELFSAETDYWLSTRFYGGLGYGYSNYGELGFGINYISDNALNLSLDFNPINPNTYNIFFCIFMSMEKHPFFTRSLRPVVEIDLSLVDVGLTGNGESENPYSIAPKA